MHHATGSDGKANVHISQLDDRLKREGGAKTHKQRVEELNKYLSTLSEHHDMPRIGPG
jgi:protein FAM32A